LQNQLVKAPEMKKLDDISKKHPFTAPEGYFDRLPGVIQARVSKESGAVARKPYFRYALQYALPVVLIAVAAVFYFRPSTTEGTENLLASVSAEELTTYLETTEFTTDYWLDESIVDEESITAIESTLFNDIDLSEVVIDNQYELTIDFENF
jgi:hypothetical protein